MYGSALALVDGLCCGAYVFTLGAWCPPERASSQVFVSSFADLLRRDFTATAQNRKCCGDITDITTDEGKLYLASLLDLSGRRLLAAPMSDHPDDELACDAIQMAAAVRGGRSAIDGVIFNTDRGSTYTATDFTNLCQRVGMRQSMGRVGSCFDNAASEASFSTLEHEFLSRHNLPPRPRPAPS